MMSMMTFQMLMKKLMIVIVRYDSVNISVDDQVAVYNIQDFLYMRENSFFLCLLQNCKYCCNIFVTDHDI